MLGWSSFAQCSVKQGPSNVGAIKEIHDAACSGAAEHRLVVAHELVALLISRGDVPLYTTIGR